MSLFSFDKSLHRGRRWAYRLMIVSPTDPDWEALRISSKRMSQNEMSPFTMSSSSTSTTRSILVVIGSSCFSTLDDEDPIIERWPNNDDRSTLDHCIGKPLDEGTL